MYKLINYHGYNFTFLIQTILSNDTIILQIFAHICKYLQILLFYMIKLYYINIICK